MKISIEAKLELDAEVRVEALVLLVLDGLVELGLHPLEFGVVEQRPTLFGRKAAEHGHDVLGTADAIADGLGGGIGSAARARRSTDTGAACPTS